jgi:DNA-directed RNA polymerase alpha subunit
MDETNGETTETTEAAAPDAAPPPNRDAETLAKVVVLNRDVTDARFEWERLHERTKAAKAVLEERQSRLNDYINEIGREYPLFDGPKAGAPAEDAWRAEPIDELGLSAALAAKLLEAGIETVGALCDFRRDGRGFTGIRGVGEAAATKIEDALENFFDLHRVAPDVNAEVLAGVREAEQARGGKRGGDDDEPEQAEPGWPSSATDAWRLAPINELGLAERTAEVLAGHDIRTIGEVVAMLGDDCLWISERESLDVSDCLDRFRGRLSDAQIVDLDAARAGEPAPEAPKRRGRKARVGA